MPPGSTLCTFFVPAEAVTWVDSWDVIGLNATNSGGFKVEGLFVPNGYSAYRERVPTRASTTPLYKFPLNSFFATGFCSVTLGIASVHAGCQRGARHEETPRSAKLRLRDNHLVRFQLGEAERPCARRGVTSDPPHTASGTRWWHPTS